MTDVDTDCSERYVSGTDASSVDAERSRPRPPPPPPPEKVRARSARDLVCRQEQLVTMLQNMKTDLAKMDREARHIKEDVVRSNQLCDVMVHMQQTHHLAPSVDGYNMSYSLPKVSCAYRRPSQDIGSRSRFLNQLSSFMPSGTSSRRSSVCNQSSRRTRLDDQDQTSRSPSETHTRSTTSSTTEDNTSGTESECDEPNSRSRTSSFSNTSQSSGESQIEAAGSSTESMSSLERSSPVVNQRRSNVNRRSSYFYTATTRQAEVQTCSDDVEV